MSHETATRAGAFLVVFGIVALWELWAPRRALNTSKSRRWFSNLTITFLNPVIARIVSPVMPVAMAVLAQKNAWGLMNHYDFSFWLQLGLGVLVLDLIIYLQHVMFHTLPVLWRIHMMHHADLDFDVTTGLRFHPIEILLSLGIKLSAVTLLGPPVAAVLVFEILLNATAMFNHANIRIPRRVDRWLRLVVVTPDMHRVHHSVTIRETNSNFGFNLPWWDRLFGTYRAQPAAGHKGMTIGLSQFRDPARLSLPWILALPFIGNPGSYAINGRGADPAKGKKKSTTR